RLFAPVAAALSDFGLFKVAETAFATQVTERKALDPSKWNVLDSSLNGGDPALAWDGDATTHWLTNEVNLPEALGIDMGSLQTLTGIGYLPRQDGERIGLVNRYVFETSVDGTKWETAASGEFSNIVANPILQFVDLGRPVQARYFRFTIEAVANAQNNRSVVSIAEFEVYSK